jgi:hypothetical protein
LVSVGLRTVVVAVEVLVDVVAGFAAGVDTGVVKSEVEICLLTLAPTLVMLIVDTPALPSAKK